MKDSYNVGEMIMFWDSGRVSSGEVLMRTMTTIGTDCKTEYFIRVIDPVLGTQRLMTIGPSDIYQGYWSNEETTEVCNHSWATYIGLTDTYDYCRFCDIRRS